MSETACPFHRFVYCTIITQVMYIVVCMMYHNSCGNQRNVVTKEHLCKIETNGVVCNMLFKAYLYSQTTALSSIWFVANRNWYLLNCQQKLAICVVNYLLLVICTCGSIWKWLYFLGMNKQFCCCCCCYYYMHKRKQQRCIQPQHLKMSVSTQLL